MNARRNLIAVTAVWLAVGGGWPAGGISVAGLARAAAGPQQEQVLRYAHIDVTGFLMETLPQVYLFESENDTLHGLTSRLQQARRDAAVDGVIVRVGGLYAGWAKVQQLRRELARCRNAGKEVICLLEGADNLNYYLATAADRVVIAPADHLMVSGLRAEAIFARGLLDKLGIKADIVQAGKYKTAGEPLTRTGPSEAFRESVESLLQDYYEQLVEGIAGGRDIPPERVEQLLAEGPYTSQEALKAGLVDAVMFSDEQAEALQARRGRPVVVLRDYGERKGFGGTGPGPMDLFRMLLGGPTPTPRPAGPTIAVLYAVGPVVLEADSNLGLGQQVISAREVRRIVRDLQTDGSVKAVVLRVDSPGGSALASDLIWRELRLLDGHKPVIASFSDTAASGGYYIAAGARRIVAEPGTLTGSIGVFGGKLVFADLLDKVGLSVAVFERGGSTTMGSLFTEFSERDRQKLLALLDDIYRRFLQRVAETRPDLDPDGVDAVAQGRVWTGQQAHANGLVDVLGDLETAIEEARREAGIPPEQNVTIRRLPEPRSVIEMLLFNLGDRSGVGSLLTDVERLLVGKQVRAYVQGLILLRRETGACLLPALLTIR